MVKIGLEKGDFIWIGFLIVLIGVGFVYAYNSELDPSVMGHSADEIDGVGSGSEADSPMIRYTRGEIRSNIETAHDKDLLCSSEFGDNYMAADLNEVAQHYGSKVVVPISRQFTVSNSIFYIVSRSSQESNSIAFDTGFIDGNHAGFARVACIRKDALIRYSRGEIKSNSHIDDKDSLCSNEFGSEYMTANLHELAQYHGSAVVAINEGFKFVVSDSDALCAATSAYGTIEISEYQTVYVNNFIDFGKVACIRNS